MPCLSDEAYMALAGERNKKGRTTKKEGDITVPQSISGNNVIIIPKPPEA